MTLTNAQVKNAKPKDKSYKLYDEKGLLLLVHKNGSKYWQFKYRYQSKEKLLQLGVYPEVPLKEARDKRDAARRQVADNIDPSEAKKEQRRIKELEANSLFKSVAEQWYQQQVFNWASSTAKKNRSFIDRYLTPKLGNYPVTDIKPSMVLEMLRSIERSGKIETVHKVKRTVSQIFRYAIAADLLEYDPTSNLMGALKTQRPQHRSAITDPADFGQLLVAIDNYEGSEAVMAALKLSPLFFVRPGELRQMEWSEIDWDKRQWVISEERMKMREALMVPLENQAYDLLKDLFDTRRLGEYVFPSARPGRPLSDNAVRTDGLHQ